MTAALRRPELAETVFGFVLSARLLTKVLSRWVLDLGLVIEKVEATRPAGAPEDWQSGTPLRLPFAAGNCRDGGVVCGPALMALADSAMLFACAAAWNGYRPMTPIDRTMHLAASEFRRSRRCTRCALRTDDDLLPRVVVECDRPSSGRNGIGRVCHVVSRVPGHGRLFVCVHGVGWRQVAGNRAATGSGLIGVDQGKRNPWRPASRASASAAS